MQPGRTLDVEIAKSVLGLSVWWDSEKKKWMCFDRRIPDHRVPVPKYSTNTDRAHRIVMEFQNRGYMVHISSKLGDNMIIWKAVFFQKDNERPKAARGETLAHAICLAGLAARSKPNIPNSKN